MNMTRKHEDFEPNCTDIPWRCLSCGTLLAYIDSATRTAIRVKSGDTFWWIVNADVVSTACRKCGAYSEKVNTKDGK